MRAAQRDASGFGWNDLTKTITATEEVWRDYTKVHHLLSIFDSLSRADTKIQAHKDAIPFKKRSFVLYDEMAEIVDDIIAVGDHAFRPGEVTTKVGPKAKTVSSVDDDEGSNSDESDEEIEAVRVAFVSYTAF